MDEMQRRAFMKGAAIGALAFSVGGAEVMLTPRQAQAQNVPLRTLTPNRRHLGAMGEALVPGARDAGIVYFVDQQISIPARRHSCRCVSSACGRRSPISIAPRSVPSTLRAARPRRQAFASFRLTSSTTSSTDAAEQDRRLEGPRALCLNVLRGDASMSSMPPWTATPRSACVQPISHRQEVVRSASWLMERKSRCRYCRCRRFGSVMHVLTKAGKKVVLFDGPEAAQT